MNTLILFGDATPQISWITKYSASVGVNEIENMLEFPHTTGNTHKSKDKIESLLSKTRAWLQGRGGGDSGRPNRYELHKSHTESECEDNDSVLQGSTPSGSDGDWAPDPEEEEEEEELSPEFGGEEFSLGREDETPPSPVFPGISQALQASRDWHLAQASHD